MTKYYIRGGGEVNLTQSNFVAAGGEGSVYFHGSEAFKIYLKPERMIPENKIAELAAIQAETVIRPRKVLVDGRGKAVGYSMRRIEDAHPLCQLFTKAFKDREGVDGATILRLVQDMHRGLSAVHAAGVLIVDANELNFLVEKSFKEVYFIDVDSYQTKSYPATALMESVKDWSAGGHWTPGSDWYSWGIVTFQLFVGIHPYKGKHPTVKSLPERMQANISVFDPKVSVPKMVPSFDVIPGAYRAWYQAVFKNGFRGPAPMDAQISVVLVSARAVASSDKIELTKIRDYDGTILEYLDGGLEELTLFVKDNKKQVWLSDGRREHTEQVEGNGHLGVTAEGVPLYAWLDHNNVRIKDLRRGGGEVVISLKGTAIATSGGRFYVQSGDNIVELTFFGSNLLVAGQRIVAKVMPLATKLFPGVAIQSVLGAWYANTFPTSGKSMQFRLSELDGYRVMDAKCEGAVLMVTGERAGQYDRFVYEVHGSSVSLRWADRNVGYAELNFVTIPRGVCAQIDEADELALFAARGTAQGKRVSDPVLSGDLRLTSRGDEVMCFRGNELYKLSTKK
jgi:hypothetical protein